MFYKCVDCVQLRRVSPLHVLTVGDLLTLECTTDVLDHVDWYYYDEQKQTTVLISTQDILVGNFSKSFQLESTGQNVHKLTIPTVTLSQSGTYECVEGQGTGDRANIEISIVRKNFSVSGDQTVRVGQRVILTCVTGLDSTVDWRFQHGRHHDFVLLSFFGEIIHDFIKDYEYQMKTAYEYYLIIREAKLSNGGVYECIENDGIGPGRGKVRLDVNIRVSVSPQVVIVGQTAILICATGLDDPVEWYFHSPQTDQQTISQRLTNGVKTENGVHKLVVPNVQTNNNGTYQCVHGSDRVNISLYVNESSSDEREVRVGETVTLPCASNTSVDWSFCNTTTQKCQSIYSRQSVNVDHVTRFNVDLDRNSLTIHDWNVYDAGSYYCTDDDGFGRRLSSVQLHVANITGLLFVQYYYDT